MNKKVLLTATVQSHIAQFHKPLAKMLHDNGYEVHVAAKTIWQKKTDWKLILQIKCLMCRLTDRL